MKTETKPPNHLTSPQSGARPELSWTTQSLLFGSRTDKQGDIGPDFRPLPFSALAVTTDDVAAANLHNSTRLSSGRLSLTQVQSGTCVVLNGQKKSQVKLSVINIDRPMRKDHEHLELAELEPVSSHVIMTADFQ